MKKICFFLAAFLLFITVSGENYYYDDYSALPDNLDFIDENGKAQMQCNTDEGYLRIFTNTFCYPQFFTPFFDTGDSSRLIVEIKNRFVYGGLTTVKVGFGTSRYDVGQISSVYEWTVQDFVLDLTKHTADLYTDGKYVSSLAFAADKTAEQLISASKRLNIGHMLNRREAQYDYAAVYKAEDNFTVSYAGIQDGKTVVIKTSNPLAADVLDTKNFSIDGFKTVRAEADGNIPKTYKITFDAPLKPETAYTLCCGDTVKDIFENAPQTANVDFVSDKREVVIKSLLKSKSGGKLRVTVNADNNSQTDKTCTLVVAFYKTGAEGAKMLVSCKNVEIPLAANTANIQYLSEKIDVPANASYECFVWDSMDGMKILY